MFMTTRTVSRKYVTTGVLSLILFCYAPGVLHAATFNIADGDVAALITAIQIANTNGDATDIINLSAGGTYTLTTVFETPSEFNNAGPVGLPVIKASIIINGNGATIRRSTAGGTPDFALLAVSGRTASCGDSSCFTNPILTLNQIVLTGASRGGLHLNSATALVQASTITANTGGGINNYCGYLSLLNSTVSFNTSDNAYGGGGIFLWNFSCAADAPRAHISFSTIFENQNTSGTNASGQPYGPGYAIAQAFGDAGDVIVKNSVLASPARAFNPAAACYGAPMVSLGHNIAGDASCGLTGPGDLSSTNPLLGPTVNNGGLTPTSLAVTASPTSDTVPLAYCTDVTGAAVPTDQRGVSRPQGPACDIGAVDILAPDFFTYAPPAPLASPPGDVVVDTLDPSIRTPQMVLDGGGTFHQHIWLAKANATGSLTLRLRVGNDCCEPGINPYISGGTITARIFRQGETTALMTFNVTEPPPVIIDGAVHSVSASDSRTIPAIPGAGYIVTLSNFMLSGLPPLYDLKFDGAESAAFSGGPHSVFDGGGTLDGVRWFMNVGAGEALTFSVLPGGPANLYGPSPNVLKKTFVAVFDPNHVQRLATTQVDLNGSILTIPDAGTTPGPWSVFIAQPFFDISDYSARAPYRVLKGVLNPSGIAVIPETRGLDPGVYSAWFTAGEGSLEFLINAPMSSVDIRVTQQGTVSFDEEPVAFAVPTNQLIQEDRAGVGQLHVTILAPPGTISEPAELDIPFISDRLTRVTVNIRDVLGGQPSLSVGVVAVAVKEDGRQIATLRVSNDGTGNAFNVNIVLSGLRTLVGTGDVTLVSGLPMALPILSPGQSIDLPIELNVPSTVLRFSLSEGLTMTDHTGAILSMNQTQTIAPVDTTKPTIIFGPLASVTQTTITLTWTTDERATSRVDYGVGSTVNRIVPEDSVYITNHRVTIRGLLPNTTYSYIVSGHDAAGNLYASSRRTVRTAP